MKTKLFFTVTATLIVGIVLGVVGSRFATRMKAYANVSVHASQGRSIMQQIAAYRDANGTAPDQQWFSSLGDITKTCEGFQWVYLNPPLILDDKREVIILTATNDNSRYLCGFSDLAVIFTELEKTKKANKP